MPNNVIAARKAKKSPGRQREGAVDLTRSLPSGRQVPAHSQTGMQRIPMPCSCARAVQAAAVRPSLSGAAPAIFKRAIHAPAAIDAAKRVPKPRGKLSGISGCTSRSRRLISPVAGPYTDPASLLAASKRGLESYAEKLGTWSELFTKTTGDLRDAGMDVRETRYTLWLLEKYRCVPVASPALRDNEIPDS